MSASEPQILFNYINGIRVPPSTGEYLDNKAPATSVTISKIPRSCSKDVDEAVAAAKDAFGEWSQLSSNQRADFLDKIADKIEERKDELAAIESQDTGKPTRLTSMIDIPRAISNFRFFAGAVRHDSTKCHEMGDALNYTLRIPIGVSALITPWNLPLYLLTWKVAPCLAMGNTIVAKPSELTPLSANILAEIIIDVGLPKGVFNIVHGLGKEAGHSLVAHKDVSLVSFTGGTSTGKVIAATAAPDFKKLSLELGGKNPSIVFADCEFKEMLPVVVKAAFANQGQICLCGSRIFVEEGLYTKFVERFVEETKKLTIGDPTEANVLGSLISLQHREKIEYYVNLAQEEGGVIKCGGCRPNLQSPFNEGAFYCPTVITGLKYDSRTATEEIFGPVVTIHSFKDEEDALKQANHVRYGLAGSVWSTNLKKAHRVAKKVESGMIWVNCWLHRDLRVPFGGVKDSGIGREGGDDSLRFFSDSKNICIHY